MRTVLSGIDAFKEVDANKYPGNIGFLCHAASVDNKVKHSIFTMKEKFGPRLKALFAPQHGLVGNVQDNMIESAHFQHPYFNIPVHSLYSETRVPTDAMLKDLDIIFVDLQDVGTRIYTYIYTLILMMKKCGEKKIKVVVLDRVNPINGVDIEGNELDLNFKSFVGLLPIPVRHGLTMGEVGLMAKELWGYSCDYEVIKMQGWNRAMNFQDTGLPWVLPSPNLPTHDGAFTFVGTVLFEGTNISEGRGTTRSLEIVGHPKIEPWKAKDELEKIFASHQLSGFVLRPVVFQPTFQKHAKTDCGGFQIHISDYKKFKPWLVSQIIMQYFYKILGSSFEWKLPPYEYELEKMPIDLINGTDRIRYWIEKQESLKILHDLEDRARSDFEKLRSKFLLYK